MEKISKFEIEEIVKGIPGGFFIFMHAGNGVSPGLSASGEEHCGPDGRQSKKF